MGLVHIGVSGVIPKPFFFQYFYLDFNFLESYMFLFGKSFQINKWKMFIYPLWKKRLMDYFHL
jgi:hypothetical protein